MSSVSDHYAAAASRLRDQYGSVEFDQVHRAVLPFLPPTGSRIADIGAGSGRDARALADLGYTVTAVEPSAAMRRHASLLDTRRNPVWVDDRLPNLGAVRASNIRFAFILCSAVLLHVEAGDLSPSFRTLAALLEDGGRLAVSVRPERVEDAPGVVVDHDEEAILSAATTADLRLLGSGAAADVLRRPDIAWSWYVFEKRCQVNRAQSRSPLPFP